MSHNAVNWALNQKTLKPGPWVTLIMLADRHNKDTKRCDPDQMQLAADCNMSRATVNRHLDELEQNGLIKRVQRQDPITLRQMRTFYILGVDFDDPPLVEHAVYQNETRGAKEENENTDQSRVSNLDTEAVSQKTGDPCLKNDDSRVSLLRLASKEEPVKEPVKEPYAHVRAREETDHAAMAELDEIAQSWVRPVVACRTYAASAISLTVARHMLTLDLVSPEQLRAAGVKF